MHRSNAQRTGTNDIPLTTRRWGGGAPPSNASPSPYGGDPYSGGRPPYDQGGGYPSQPPPPAPSSRQEPPADQPRKRRSRWGDADAKSSLQGLPAVISANVSAQELDNYAIHVRLDEINKKLATGDVVPPERMRSPSPPPQYDGQGRRTNTREVRYRKKLEGERMTLIDKAIKADPNFRPPAEYQAAKRNLRPQEKVYIPTAEFPEINFFGLLVGPRGNSLKSMEQRSGAKISIRGKGSVKPGKERQEAFTGDEDDELHCLVMGDTQEKVDACVALINKVIETAASTPEAQNDHKRNQLRELAALNGTLRDDENQLCQNCGEKGHRKYECPQARNYSAGIICRACGGAGHMARDCFNRGNPNGAPGGPAAPRSQFDSEYASLMAELGEGGGGGAQGPVMGAITAGGENAPAQGAPAGPVDANGKKIPPWRVPENWFSNRPPQPRPGGYGGGYGGGYDQQQQQQYAQYYAQQAGQAGYAQNGASDPYAA